MRTPLVALLLSFALPAAASSVWEQEPDSDWTREVPAPRQPGEPTPPPVPEGGFSTPDEITFRDRLEKGLLDRVCRGLNLRVNQDFDIADLGGVGGRFGRRLRQLPNNHEAIIDTMQVRFSVGHTFAAPDAVDGVAFSFWIGASAEGESVVMRPLEGSRSCEELDTLLDVREVKTVFPFRPNRIREMRLGEVWRLPIRLSWGYAPSVTLTEGTAALTITAGGYNQGGQAALSLYRMAPDKIRMRFRIEDAEVRTNGGSLLATFPALQMASVGEGILLRQVDRLIARGLSDYVSAQLSYFHGTGHGQRIMLEVILDPSNEEQLQALTDVVRGDLTRVLRLVAERNGLLPERTARANARELREHYATGIGAVDAETFLDTYRKESSDWNLHLPFLTRQRWNTNTGEDRMERLDSGEGEVRIYHADKLRESHLFYLPFVGSIVKDNTSRSAQIVTQIIPEGSAPPAAVYIRQRGFERIGASGVRDMVEEYSELTSLIGRESGAPGARTQLPVDAMFPEVPAERRMRRNHRGELTPAPEPNYDKGAMTLSILLSPEGLRQVIHADPAAIVRAWGNTLDEADRQFLAVAQSVGFDERAVRREARRVTDAVHDNLDPSYYTRLARRATELVADLAALREAPSHDRQAKALARLIDGEGESGLKYDELMAVFVQLAQPSEVRADFNINVKKGEKGVPNLASRYRLNGGIDTDPLINRAGQLRGRFNNPSLTFRSRSRRRCGGGGVWGRRGR
ncbi:MAG: hypothetical protein SF051_16480 [Elusimicrobiota bacterium]|nr:hypothetical protein [Elusimicrobiota bacterium]